MTAPGRLPGSLLLGCGVVGPPLFVAVLLIEGAVRPGYDAWRMAGSSLSLGPGGWVQVANFVVTGILILAFALAVRGTIQAGSVLFAIFAVSLVLAGIFVTDPQAGYPPGTALGPPRSRSLHGTVHTLASVLAFTSLTIACLVFANRFRRESGSGSWALYSCLTGVVMALPLVAFVVASGVLGEVAGLLERIAVVSGWAWISLLAIHLIRASMRPVGPN